MTPSRNDAAPTVAVVGGGRWARTIADVLSALLDQSRTIVLCSPGHPEGWLAWLDSRPCEQLRRFAIEPRLEQLARDEGIGTAFVARAARNNATTAIQLLSAGKNTFVEKPFALGRADAERVIAATTAARCSVGHVLLFSKSLRTFATEAAKLRSLRRISIEWHDAKGEFRYGEPKYYDHSINVVQDVFPHIWCLIRLLVPDCALQLQTVHSSYGGQAVQLDLSAANIQIDVTIRRDALLRRRAIHLNADVNGEIDFSTEPGWARIGNRTIDVHAGFVSPLGQELSYFLDPSSDAIAARFTNVKSALETITLAEAAVVSIRTQQTRTIRTATQNGASPEQQEHAVFALREWIGGYRCSEAKTTHRNHAKDDEQMARRFLRWLTDAESAPPVQELNDAPWIEELKRAAKL